MTVYQTKKLSLDTEKTEILKTALFEAMPADKFMAVIYQTTLQQLQQLRPDANRVMLTQAQVEIVSQALRRYCDTHGDDAQAAGMLRQLTTSRRAYAASQAGI